MTPRPGMYESRRQAAARLAIGLGLSLLTIAAAIALVAWGCP